MLTVERCPSMTRGDHGMSPSLPVKVDVTGVTSLSSIVLVDPGSSDAGTCTTVTHKTSSLSLDSDIDIGVTVTHRTSSLSHSLLSVEMTLLPFVIV